VLGADHGGYVKRMRAAVAALSDGRVPLDMKLCQLVKLTRDGQPFKMSKRAGTFVTLSDLIELVGPDVTRFVMLTRKNDAPLDFDIDKVLEQSKENPVFYVQYAHARGYSVLSKAREAGIATADADLALADLGRLGTPGELTLARKLGEWPRQVEVAANNHEPHRIAFYLYELASDFHALQHQGKLDPELRFLREDAPETTLARLALVRATAVVISAGLGILGVTPMDEMR
jgi:arginyl-tRNA synthetase